MNNLKDIHNSATSAIALGFVVLSGFQWTIWRIYTTTNNIAQINKELFYQDFNEQFEGYTQLWVENDFATVRCFIRISMNNLKDIHNCASFLNSTMRVVLSGFQWTIWRIYTTIHSMLVFFLQLFYQDFNEQFEGYTQRFYFCRSAILCCFIRISMNNLKDIHNSNRDCDTLSCVVLSGFQWTIWRIYTTYYCCVGTGEMLFYQDFNEQFEGYTQLVRFVHCSLHCCFIRISMNNLKDIHNCCARLRISSPVVLSGFQRYFCMQYTTLHVGYSLFFIIKGL